jgi:hypothetical protein
MKNLISLLICKEDNKIILARQFVSMTKQTLLEYSGHFYKNFQYHKDKNCFDLDGKRFSYFKIETIFLILISNSNFNIFETFEILKLIKRSLFDICKEGINEETIKQNYINIIMSVDDIVTSYSRQEHNYSNLIQARTMESFNERDFNRELKAKEELALSNIYKGIEEIEALKRNNLYITNSVSKESLEKDLLKQEQEEEIKQTIGLKLKEQLLQRALIRRQEELQLSK